MMVPQKKSDRPAAQRVVAQTCLVVAERLGRPMPRLPSVLVANLFVAQRYGWVGYPMVFFAFSNILFCLAQRLFRPTSCCPRTLSVAILRSRGSSRADLLDETTWDYG